MAGFFGLFGKKTKYVDEPQQNISSAQSSEDFYLSSDDAKTLGDIEYMRTPKAVRRTFPKTKNKKNSELLISVSATGKQSVKGDRVSNNAPASIPQFKTVESTPQSQPVESTPQSQPVESSKAPETPKFTPKRTPDNSMDMFRNMARQIKKY